MAKSSTALPYTCKYNQVIGCADTKACWRCGWNPDVEARRKFELRESLTPKSRTETNPKKRTLAVTWKERTR